MSNKSEVVLIAEAILGNIRLIELLIAKLPTPTVEAVAKEVAKVNPTPVQVAPQAPVAPVVTPVVEAPAPIPTPTPAPVAMPPAPVATPPATAGAVPFTDNKGMVKYVMDKYRELGAAKGAEIQTVLTGLGVPNINDVKPEHYAALFAGIEAIKVS